MVLIILKQNGIQDTRGLQPLTSLGGTQLLIKCRRHLQCRHSPRAAATNTILNKQTFQQLQNAQMSGIIFPASLSP